MSDNSGVSGFYREKLHNFVIRMKIAMFKSIAKLQNYSVRAIDGPVGSVGDFYFYKGLWLIRYLLLNVPDETRDSGVLISTGDIIEISHKKNVFSVNLSTSQVLNSPEIDISQPILRKHERALLEYYGWPADWLQEEHDVTPIGELSGEPENEETDDTDQFIEPDLLSCDEITDLFQVQANDSEVGKLTDFIIDDEDWLIRFIAAQFPQSPTGYILLHTSLIDRVDWTEAQIYLTVSLDKIKQSPIYDPTKPLNQQKLSII